ncbi:MAG: SDR family oxidoreductase [Oscillibacter sp.]|nr:SDR family oxidoreductase [Oscillibacter sp.]
MLLEGKTAVITGCSRGIGKAVLDRMTAQGASAFALVRREDAAFTEHCAALSEKYGVDVRMVYADFENENAVTAAAREILKTKERIDILVNNIGVAFPQRMLAMTPMEAVKRSFQINVFSGMLFTQLISKSMMRGRRGSIVFLSSSAAFDGGANIEYSAGKAAVLGEVRRLAVELGGFGIRVNAIAPGLTDTDMGGITSEEVKAAAMSRNIMKRMGEPEEIADATVFLASDLSRFMTGQTLRVDGGLL